MSDRAAFTFIEGAAVIAVLGVMAASAAAWFAYRLATGRWFHDSDPR